MKYNYHIVCEKGNLNTVNGDFAVVHEIDNDLICIVCDGVSGTHKGDIAAKLCAEEFYNQFKNSTEENYLKRIKTILISVNDHVNHSNKIDEKHPSATTADVLVIKNHTLYWGHIGDSRIYNVKNKKIHRLTKDHSVIQKLIDKGFLTMKQAEYFPNKNMMFAAIGNKRKMVIDVSRMAIHPKDSHKVLLCTDGVTNLVSDSELEVLINSNTVEKAAKEITSLIKNRDAADDYSFILVDLHSNKKS